MAFLAILRIHEMFPFQDVQAKQIPKIRNQARITPKTFIFGVHLIRGLTTL